MVYPKTESRPNRTEYAVLGLLALGPKSGYDIKRQVEQTLSHFWNESYGHIYPILKRLHVHGLVEKREETSPGGRKRYVYSLTEDGDAELRAWLRRPAEPAPRRNELLLKVFFGQLIPPAELAVVLREHHERLAAEVSTLGTIARTLDAESADDPAYRYWRMTLELGIRATTTFRDWCADSLRILEEEEEEEER